jgi:hypothetical protein
MCPTATLTHTTWPGSLRDAANAPPPTALRRRPRKPWPAFCSAIVTEGLSGIAIVTSMGTVAAAARTGSGDVQQRLSARARLGAWLPEASEIAWATIIGAFIIGATNAPAIAVTVPLPPAGWRLRVLHHWFDLVEVIGLGVLLALPAAIASRLRPGPTWLGWLVFAVASIAGMDWLLGAHLAAVARVVANGRVAFILQPLYLLVCGLAIPTAYALGALLGRHRYGSGGGLFLTACGIVLNHAILRDDYPGVHAAIAWAGLGLGGATLARCQRRRLPTRRWRRAGLVLLVMCVLCALLLPPPNRVRLELFREPGAVVSWIAARTLWKPPTLSVAPAPLPPFPHPHP